MTLDRSLRGALAGAIAAAVWAAQQPLDKRVFDVDYDDTELLGKLVSRGPEWRAIGTALHIQNGALFGAAYALGKPFLPGPPVLRGLAVALAEHFATWPAIGLAERHHPARRDLPKLAGNPRALAQATWRHALFGVVMGALEHAFNDRSADEPPPIPVSSNGHGDLEAAAAVVA
ncbi:MAG: hypothetical protein QOD53_146 [Thermoleophilaceae bacterium]|jgi:hypothetical protein|nr:hypothetical protein [Thermoleophilaceae bacterium]